MSPLIFLTKAVVIQYSQTRWLPQSFTHQSISLTLENNDTASHKDASRVLVLFHVNTSRASKCEKCTGITLPTQDPGERELLI